MTHWTEASGAGFNALSRQQQSQAEVAYADWTKKRLARDKSKGVQSKDFSLHDYVSFVQDKRRAELAEQEKSATTTQSAVIAPPTVEASHDKTRGDDGELWSRRKTLLADLLAGHYDLAHLQQRTVENIKRIELDRGRGFAILHLTDGSRLHDHGDRIEAHDIKSHNLVAAEMAHHAERRGWKNVNLTGSNEFKEAAALALALKEPPIQTDYELSPAGQKRLAAVLAQRPAVSITPTNDNALAAEVTADVNSKTTTALSALDIVRLKISESNRRTEELLARRPTDFDARARSSELDRRIKAGQQHREAEATAAEERAKRARAGASLFDRQSRKDATAAEAAAVEARKHASRASDRQWEEYERAEKIVKGEGAERKAEQSRFDRNPAVQNAIQERHANSLIAYAIGGDEPDQEVLAAIDNGGLAHAQRFVLDREKNQEAEKKHKQEQTWKHDETLSQEARPTFRM